MPIYEYRCRDCDKVFEKIQSGFDERTEACPACGGESKRIISNTSFVLKGSGWYVTDYCNRHGGAESGGNGGNGGNGDSGSTSKDGTASPDSTPAAPPASKTSGASDGKAPAAASCSTACGGAAAAK